VPHHAESLWGRADLGATVGRSGPTTTRSSSCSPTRSRLTTARTRYACPWAPPPAACAARLYAPPPCARPSLVAGLGCSRVPSRGLSEHAALVGDASQSPGRAYSSTPQHPSVVVHCSLRSGAYAHSRARAATPVSGLGDVDGPLQVSSIDDVFLGHFHLRFAGSVLYRPASMLRRVATVWRTCCTASAACRVRLVAFPSGEATAGRCCMAWVTDRLLAPSAL
jgi:hypothetical protein